MTVYKLSACLAEIGSILLYTSLEAASFDRLSFC